MFRRIVLDNYVSFDHLEFDLVGEEDEPRGYALIYGENGSGKSNLISSVGFLKDSIRTLDGDPAFDDLSVLARNSIRIGSEDPMHLLYEFQIGAGRWAYEMNFDIDGRIIEETLDREVADGRHERCFAVENSDDGILVSFGDRISETESTESLRERISALWGKHSALAVMASELHGVPNPVGIDAFDGIGEAIGMIDSVKVCMSGRSNLFDLLSGTVSKEDAKILDAYEKALFSFFVRLFTNIRGVRYERREVGDRISYSLYADKRIAGRSVSVPFERESSGTQKLLEMAPALLECNCGGTAFIDEVDSGIHEKMIRDMMDHILGNLDGQLVLTTHCTLLLETAEPDNVLILRGDNMGFKQIVPISDTVPAEKDRSNRVRYLNGMFDGIPYIRDLNLPDVASGLKHSMEDCRRIVGPRRFLSCPHFGQNASPGGILA